MDRIRQVFLSLLGIAAFVFVFYLVFKEDQRFMIIFGLGIAAIILIALVVGLIWYIIDKREEKRRTRHIKF
jgi:uncharacterized membrane protein